MFLWKKFLFLWKSFFSVKKSNLLKYFNHFLGNSFVVERVWNYIINFNFRVRFKVSDFCEESIFGSSFLLDESLINMTFLQHGVSFNASCFCLSDFGFFCNVITTLVTKNAVWGLLENCRFSVYLFFGPGQFCTTSKRRFWKYSVI